LGIIIEKFKDSEFNPKLVELIQTGPLITEETIKQSDLFDIISSQCLVYNTVILTKDGKLYSCGKGGIFLIKK
jgi:alpha-tubulin suppressor-like RCC1 family protein